MSHSDIDCLSGGLRSPSAVLVDVLIVQAIADRYERARKLCEILKERDDDLLPVFCQALIDTGQRQVARLLGFPGSSAACSHTSVNNITLIEFHFNENNYNITVT